MRRDTRRSRAAPIPGRSKHQHEPGCRRRCRAIVLALVVNRPDRTTANVATIASSHNAQGRVKPKERNEREPQIGIPPRPLRCWLHNAECPRRAEVGMVAIRAETRHEANGGGTISAEVNRVPCRSS